MNVLVLEAVLEDVMLNPHSSFGGQGVVQNVLLPQARPVLPMCSLQELRKRWCRPAALARL